MIHFKKEWSRLGIWAWQSEFTKKIAKKEAEKQEEYERGGVTRAKGRYQLMVDKYKAMEVQ